ncbi:hypothetical protein EDC04DRAFT_175573 [Pisolithus marmoratus]|nr:hypothetical protein EDC04DRAFT_175573 [Pisolithus marmoratus]
MVDHPRIQKLRIQERLLGCRRTLFKLSRQLEQAPSRFKHKSTSYVVSRKGKLRKDPISENESGWKYQDTGIECGCCFSSYPFDNMVQCPDAHLFCKSCMTSYSSTLLGEHNPNLVCMDQSGCTLPFPESELKRSLSSKMLELYGRVKQREEIEEAGLDNLEECPLCEYKCVIENEMEKLFRCENVECGAVTCRGCKKLEHLPMSCEEVEEDRRLNAQHHVEEAMSRALVRNCPKCQKVFIKESGCNKMTCPNCSTVSCYICRQIIGGYEHFNQVGSFLVVIFPLISVASSNDTNTTSPGQSTSKCKLWDKSIEQRHASEVRMR